MIEVDTRSLATFERSERGRCGGGGVQFVRDRSRIYAVLPSRGGHFSSVFLVPFLGAEKVPKGSPKGVVSSNFFRLLGYLLGYLVLASFFNSFWGASGAEKAVFSM